MATRVLHVLNNLGSGGAESFIMNVYRNINREKVQFDFLIRSTQNGTMLDEIKKMGGRIFIQPPFPRQMLQNYSALDHFLQEHASEYKAIHVHANSLVYVKPLQLAKRYGIPCRIIHSHSTKSSMLALHKFNIRRIDKWITDRFACSDVAGKWMFPGREYKMIPNGINLDNFAYNEQDRDAIREKYNIGDKVVVGNVGRFSPSKNHSFIVDVFEVYHRKNPNSVLMFVGEGADKERIWNQVLHRGLFDDVVFTGAVSDVWRYLSAMDVFLFPSLWEGLGIVLIEAQANALPSLVSSNVPREVALSELIHFLNLKLTSNKWAECIDEICRKQGGITSPVQLQQYDIKNVAAKLEAFYLSDF